MGMIPFITVVSTVVVLHGHLFHEVAVGEVVEITGDAPCGTDVPWNLGGRRGNGSSCQLAFLARGDCNRFIVHGGACK